MCKVNKKCKLNKLIVLILSVIMIVCSCSTAFSANATAPADLPTHCTIGYWENWSGVNRMTLREIDPNWDVIIVSFMMLDSSNVKATFTPDNAVYPGGEASFKQDIEFCQARGQKVLISFCSATGEFYLNDENDKEIFYNSACEIIEKYGFDGIDIDLEASILTVQDGDTLTETITPIQGYLNTVLHDMVKKFGSDFMVTMAPVHPYVQGGAVYWGSADGSSGTRGGYLPLLNNCRDILTFVHPQYYNNPIEQYNGQWWACPDWGIVGYNIESLVKLSEVLITGFETRAGFFEGLRPDQVAFGVPTYIEAVGKGYLPFEDCAEALDRLIKEYPTFRGIMAWSINKPDTNDDFVNKMQAVFDENSQTEPQTSTEFAMKLNSTYAYKNGIVEKTSGSNNDGQGVYYAQLRFEGSSLVLPLRYVAESAGLEVGYDNITGLTTITDGETTVKIIQDSSNIIVVKGGVESTVDIGTPAKPFRQVLHIPVRGVLNQFDNLTIKYDYMTGFVTVTDYDPDDTQFATLISKVQTALADL